MKTKTVISFLVFLLAFSACDSINRNSLLPNISGSAGDVLVVMNDALWKSAPGDSLRMVLEEPVPGLPQDEPMFKIIRINFSAFNKIFKHQRNIVIAKIGADQPERKIIVQQSPWAKTQIVISVLASSDSAFTHLIAQNKHKIQAIFEDIERQRLMDVYKLSQNKPIYDRIKNKYNALLRVPSGYKIDMDTTDFTWLSIEPIDIMQGVFVYSYNYTDSNTFTREYLIAKRNEYLKKYVMGEISGSYMSTEPLFPPLFSEYNLRNKKYTAEIRGLWRMNNGLAMGGPFISITQLDEKRNKVVTVEGYVFAPSMRKRDLLRQVEAIALSLTFPE